MFESDHVQISDNNDDDNNGIGRPARICDFSVASALMEDPEKAAIYSALHRDPGSFKELVESADIPNKRLTIHLIELQDAGFVREHIAENTKLTAREAVPFKMTLTVDTTCVTITPDIIELVARADEHPVIRRVIDEYSALPLVLAYDLAQPSDAGDDIVRQITEMTGVSAGIAYDLVEAVYTIMDFGQVEAKITAESD